MDDPYISPSHHDSDEDNNTTDSDPPDDRSIPGDGPHAGDLSPPPEALDPKDPLHSSAPKAKPDWGPQEPLDLHHHNGVAEGKRSPGGPFNLHKKKSPIDVLARVFPKENRSILNVVLQRNNGDVLQAIDEILSTRAAESLKDTDKTVSDVTDGVTSPPSPPPPHLQLPTVAREPPSGIGSKEHLPPSHPLTCASITPPCVSLPAFSVSATSPNFASVFSSMAAPPLSSTSALAMAGAPPFRRPYTSAHAPRGLLAMPTYPGFFPGISPNFTPGYPSLFGSSMTSSLSHVVPSEDSTSRKKGSRLASGECWSTCGDPSPQDLSSPEGDRKSPNGFNE